ncbi:MAG TPA: hypothetical protein VHJ20_16315 [Polyangia bacterium]|nr:hypothetical protein [Polyangia bacterium]
MSHARPLAVLSLFTTLAVMASTLAGCGDSSQDPAVRFVGTWHYVDSMASATCPGSDPIDESPKGNKTFERGVSHDLVDVTQFSFNGSIYGTIFCDFQFDIDGPTASATAGQGCALPGGDIFTVQSWTFSLNPPTSATDYPAEEIAQGTLTANLPGQTTPEICTYALTAHLQRITKAQ